MVFALSLTGLPIGAKTIPFRGGQTVTNQPEMSRNREETRKMPETATLQAYTLPVNSMKSPFEQEFRLPGGGSFDKEVIEKYSPAMKKVINDFAQRAGKKDEFLNWVDLPAQQLKSLDNIYAQANELKSRGANRPLVVLGIGGSKHTAEFLLNMNGHGNKGNVYFYSDIDPVSYENFLKEVGGDVQKLNFLVVSKSGTTFETSDGFKRFENALIKSYEAQGLSSEQAEKKSQEHFALATDKTANEKNLRGKIGSKNGADNNYIKELYVHDDVGGRFSIFDDPGIFTMAYAGIDKNTSRRILDSASKTSEKLLKSEDLNSNSAAKAAMMNIYSRDNGYKTTVHQLFGKIFESGGENWYKQLYLESLKDFDYMVGKSPDSMHYATEGQFSPENRKSYNTVMTIINPGVSSNYNKYTSAIADTYNETTPLNIEKLDVEGSRIKPEAIGQYIQSKHFETVYMGMLKRQSVNSPAPQTSALPEVLQPSVETYKNKFKKGSPFELTPGGN
jgi:hypothetical protein